LSQLQPPGQPDELSEDWSGSGRGHSIVEVQTWYKRNRFAGAEVAWVGGGVVGPRLGALMDAGVEQNRERPGQLGADLVVLVEVEFGEECLVAQSAGLVVAALIDAGGVAEQVEAVLQLGPGLGVVGVEYVDAGADVDRLWPRPQPMIFVSPAALCAPSGNRLECMAAA
jgi:hypothetical protein